MYASSVVEIDLPLMAQKQEQTWGAEKALEVAQDGGYVLGAFEPSVCCYVPDVVLLMKSSTAARSSTNAGWSS